MRKLVLAAVLALACAPALADPIHDNIARALKAYDTGDMRGAKQALDIASQQIAQRNAQLLATVLPRPYQGWTASKPEVAGIGNVLGGMITAKCTYSNGNARVEVSIIGDSPMLSAVAALITNPQIAMMSGAKIVTIAGQQAIVTPDGQIQLPYNNRWYIVVEGNAPLPQKIAYANAINFRALQAFR